MKGVYKPEMELSFMCIRKGMTVLNEESAAASNSEMPSSDNFLKAHDIDNQDISPINP
jgi:hypothetical protein